MSRLPFPKLLVSQDVRLALQTYEKVRPGSPCDTLREAVQIITTPALLDLVGPHNDVFR